MPPLPPPELIRKTTQEVLNQADYQWAGKGEFSPFIMDALIQLKNFLLPLIEFIQSLFNTLYTLSPFLAWATVIFLFIILLGLIWHIIYSFKMALRKGQVSKVTSNLLEEEDPLAEWV